MEISAHVENGAPYLIKETGASRINLAAITAHVIV